jgi:hypothetical protein
MSDKQIEVTIHPDGRIVAETVNMSGSECLVAPELVSELVPGEIVDSYYLDSYFDREDHDESILGVLRQQKDR